MKIGYIRVSTQEQNTMRQEVLMEQLGVDQIYIDRSSGKNANRPELKTMSEFVRKGDVVIVESISRFARNTKDLLELVEQLTAKGVEFISQKEAGKQLGMSRATFYRKLRGQEHGCLRSASPGMENGMRFVGRQKLKHWKSWPNC